MKENDLDKANKLLALAIDRIGQPEGDVAAVMLVKELKRSGITIATLTGDKHEEAPQSKPPESKPVDDAFLKRAKFPFGKYKGKRIWDVAKDDRDYLEWVSGNVTFREAKMNDVVLKILLMTAESDDCDEGDINLGD